MTKKKKYVDRWREEVGGKVVHRGRVFDTRHERDAFRLKRLNAGARPQAAALAFKDLATKWLDEHARHNKAESSCLADRRVIEGYLLPAFGDVPLGELRSNHLRDLKLALQNGRTLSGQPIRPKSVNNIVALAKAIVGMATRGDPPLIYTNPFASVDLVPVSEQEYSFWTCEERDHFIRFLQKVDPAFAEVVLVACHTGLRRSELAGLERRHLNFERRLITVAETHCFMTRKRQMRTKNRKTGWVAMNDAVFEALKDRQLAAMGAPVFEKGLLEYGSQKLARYCKALGVKPLPFHALRHTFASTLVMAGVPLYDVQKLMRHETIKMTERYAHLSPGHLADAAQAICAPSVHDDRPKDAKLLKMQG